ncbi:Uncharacterised protein [uncultured archaeon]|nr:Uncharacterised protein [uncultured archaeon]
MSALLCGGVFPVNSTIFSGGILSALLKKAACCSTSGFVGERSRTFPFGSRETITSRATTVFPRPVGRTTRVDFPIASPASASWYNLFSTVSSFKRG